MNKIFLTKKLPSRISKGHDWIFDYEIAIKEGECTAGSLVHVFTHTGSFLGIGIFHPYNKIAIRILIRKNEEFEFEEFFRKKLINAIQWRKELKIEEEIYRIFHSEPDGISGLIIDKIEKNIFIQVLTYGLELRKNIIEKVLFEIFGQEYSYHFDDSNSLRKYEQLEVNMYSFSPILVKNDKYSFYYQNKNSFSIERKELYSFLGKISENKCIWDLFSGSGHFGLHALNHNSKFVLFNDNQKESEDYIKSVMKLNSYTKQNYQVVTENVFDVLKHKKAQYPKPDILVLDFPKFTIKESGFGAYKELIIQSMKLLSKESFLLIGYQSAEISPSLFESVIADAAQDSKINYLIIKRFGNSIDVPIHPIYHHSDNLHFWLIQVK